MGVEPEEIEHALRGKRTLPRPGKEPEPAEAPRGAPTKETSRSPEAEPGSVQGGKERKGPRGQLFTEDEERRFQLRGGRFNAASKEGGDRV